MDINPNSLACTKHTINDISAATNKVPLKIPVITTGLSPASQEWLKYLEDN